MDFVLKTERLLLREFRKEDLEIFLGYRSDPVLCEFQNFMLESMDAANEFLIEQKNITLGSSKDWKQIAISDHEMQLIGDCAFKCDSYEPRIAELGITIRKEFQKQGIAYEALNALIKYVFQNLNIHKIIAIVDIRNKASIRLFENLNFSQEALLRKHFWDKNKEEWFDEIHFGLLREDLI